MRLFKPRGTGRSFRAHRGRRGRLVRMDSIGLDGGKRWTLHLLVGRRGFAGDSGSHNADCFGNGRSGETDCVESSSRRLPK